MSLTQTQPHRVPLWPGAVIAIGLSLTLSWVLVLGYGVLKLIESAI